MREDLTQILFTTFSDLYRARHLPITKSMMCYGFECGDSWFEILYELSEQIDTIAKKYNLTDDDYPRVHQVKNKMGSFRFYLDRVSNSAADQEIEQAILEASKRTALLRDRQAPVIEEIVPNYDITHESEWGGL